MSTLKAPKHVMNTYEWVRGWSVNMNVEKILKEDRQHIAQVLCDLLEGEKIDASLINKEGWHRRNSQWIMGMNQATEQAQALIRQTLDPISNQEIK